MKRLILVRHGQKKGSHLTGAGKRQIEELAQNIKKNVAQDSFFIFSSPMGQAKESAEILAELLCAPIEFNQGLYDLGLMSLPVFVQKLIPRIEENIVLVTHLDFFDPFFGFWSSIEKIWDVEGINIKTWPEKEKWGPREFFDPQMGDAILFDFENKECLYLEARHS